MTHAEIADKYIDKFQSLPGMIYGVGPDFYAEKMLAALESGIKLDDEALAEEVYRDLPEDSLI